MKVFDPPEFAKCYCAAVATAVAAVASAGVAAYGASQAGKQTAAAKAALANNPAGAYGTKVNPVKYVNNVNLPQFNPAAGAQDYYGTLPMLSQISRAVTTEGMRERDSISGGLESRNLLSSGADISQLLKGTVPTDVVNQTNRLVAERTGGAFTPGGASNQQAQTDFARSIGQTSTQLMESGLSHAPQWESMVDAFTYKPQQAFQDSLSALRARSDYTENAARIQAGVDEQTYMGAVNYEKMKSMPNPQISGAVNDQLQLAALSNQQQQNQINAMLGAVKAGAGAYAQIGKASGSADPYNNAGYINPSSLGTVAASYSTPGYSPSFGYSPGGGLYFSGYNPA